MTASNFPRPAAVRPSGRGHAPVARAVSVTDRIGGSRHGAPPTLVAVAHGSRDPRALATVHALLDMVRERRPDVPVRLGHIELNEPLLPDTLAALPPGRAVLVPLLLSRGHHVTYDLPHAAAAAPHLDTRVAAPLGPHPLLAEVLHDRLTEAGWRAPFDASDAGTPDGVVDAPGALAASGTPSDVLGVPGAVPPAFAAPGTPAPGTGGPVCPADHCDRIPGPRPHESAVVLAAAGSRDPRAAADVRRAAALLARRLGVPVVAAYASAAAPTVPEALSMLAAAGRRHTAVASYFTAPGRFAAQCAAAATGPAAAPLGAHPMLARLLLHRYDQACRGLAHQPARHRRLTPA